MDKILVKVIGTTAERNGEIILVLPTKDMPVDCMVLFVSLETWKSIKDKVEVEK